MRVLAVLSLLVPTILGMSDECPQDRQYDCVEDFKKALPYCKKAAVDQGKDFDADINCLKYSATVEKECWPCICYMAVAEHVKVKGC